MVASYLLQWSMGREEEKSAYSDNKLAAIVTGKSSSNTRLCLHSCKLIFLNEKIVKKIKTNQEMLYLKDNWRFARFKADV